MTAQGTTISQLPVQLLARILAMLKTEERFGSAALVATAWRTAAVLGTDTVYLKIYRMSEAVPKCFDSLSAWLATNSNAGITRLEFHMSTPPGQDDEMPVLQLPSLQRLPGLECLHCYGLAITAAQASSDNGKAGAEAVPGGQQAAEAVEAATAAILLPLELSSATALTELQLYNCNITVQGLNALTRLQSLTLATTAERNLPAAVTSNLRIQLRQALHQLQALTSLSLVGEVAHDDVLQHLGSLPPLQKLALVDGVFTPAGFQQLPQSLTHLSMERAASNTDSKIFNASTAPGLCQLTGLQHLNVRSGARIGLDLLASLTSLNTMDIKGAESLAGPGTLSVLTALTKLSRMQLPPFAAALVPAHVDLSALTASPQLQLLNLCGLGLDAAACRHIFPAGRQLTQLTMLIASLDMIHDGREAAFVAACCPNLDTIFLTESKVDDWVAAEDYIVAADLASMLRGWQPLQHLNHLSLDMQHLPMMPEVWQALAGLTQLGHVNVSIRDLKFLAGVLHLTSCTRLKGLGVNARSLEGEMDSVELFVTSEEAADGTNNLAQQLPQALQHAILQHVSEDNGTPELLAVLARCAADVQQAQEQQLVQQQGQIDQQQKEMAQQQGEIDQLRQELRGVQASLAAVLQQLQGQAGPGTS